MGSKDNRLAAIFSVKSRLRCSNYAKSIFSDTFREQSNGNDSNRDQIGDATVTTLKATGAQVTAGMSDTTIATPKAIKDAGDINKNLADAQKARQVLDRLIGYKISPLLPKQNLNTEKAPYIGHRQEISCLI